MLNRAVAGAMARFVTGYKLIGYKFVITCNFGKTIYCFTKPYPDFV